MCKLHVYMHIFVCDCVYYVFVCTWMTHLLRPCDCVRCVLVNAWTHFGACACAPLRSQWFHESVEFILKGRTGKAYGPYGSQPQKKRRNLFVPFQSRKHWTISALGGSRRLHFWGAAGVRIVFGWDTPGLAGYLSTGGHPSIRCESSGLTFDTRWGLGEEMSTAIRGLWNKCHL